MKTMNKLSVLEYKIKNEINFFEKRFGFNQDTKVREVRNSFFKASNYRAYMKLRELLKIIENNY